MKTQFTVLIALAVSPLSSLASADQTTLYCLEVGLQDAPAWEVRINENEGKILPNGVGSFPEAIETSKRAITIAKQDVDPKNTSLLGTYSGLNKKREPVIFTLESSGPGSFGAKSVNYAGHIRIENRPETEAKISCASY